MERVYYRIVYRGRFFKKMQWVIKIFTARATDIILKKMDNKFFLIGAGDDRYENNVRTFYEYLRDKHPEIEVYWVADKTDRIPVDIQHTIKRGTIKNFRLALHASVALYSHSDADVAPGLYRIVKNTKTVLVDLDHGQTGLKHMGYGFYSGLVYDIMCCYSNYERDIKVECGIDEKRAFTTGYAHSDSFEIVADNASIKNILIMPTWREYYVDGNKTFENTELFKAYRQLFLDERFQKTCKENDTSVTFILHPTFANYFHCQEETLKSEYGGWIDVIVNGGDMNRAIREADMFITDYSSMMWDFLYMNKPVILYWFDYVEYKEKRGIRLEKEKIGNMVQEKYEGFIELLLHSIKGEKVIDKTILNENYFTYRDKNNCQRIYEIIDQKIKEKQ